MAKIFTESFLFFCATSFALFVLAPVNTDLGGKEEETSKQDKILKVGNLAFPTSQQPTPLISFGQNILDEKQFEIQLVSDEFKGNDIYAIEFSPTLIYGLKKNLSLFISTPDALRLREGVHHSSGWEDSIIQLEYAPYTKENYTFVDQLTLVASITIPTGSVRKNPMTGKGTNSFFLGFTFSRLGINWFYFTSYGTIFNASSHRTRFGTQFLYQYGVGRRIFSNSSWLFDWMVEFDGIYSEKNIIQGITDPNSGGNIVYVTPSLFLSSKKHLVLQLGIGFPIIQQLFGRQKKENYLLEAKIAWNF